VIPLPKDSLVAIYTRDGRQRATTLGALPTKGLVLPKRTHVSLEVVSADSMPPALETFVVHPRFLSLSAAVLTDGSWAAESLAKDDLLNLLRGTGFAVPEP
jgi:hypothetical protein